MTPEERTTTIRRTLAFIFAVLLVGVVIAVVRDARAENSPNGKAVEWTQQETQQNVNYCVEEASSGNFRTFTCDYADSDQNSDGADDYTYCVVYVATDGETNGRCP